MQKFGFSMLCFGICYLLVTIVSILHTVFNIYFLRMKPMNENNIGDGYEKTKVFHPVYNIILFSFFGLIYVSGLQNPALKGVIVTGFVWVLFYIDLDILVWVVIKHKWSLSFKEYWVDFQPWIFFVYLAVFFGPVIGFGVNCAL